MRAVALFSSLMLALLAGACSLVHDIHRRPDPAAEAEARSRLAARDLEQAQHRLPYQLRLPGRLPAGTRLLNVAFDVHTVGPGRASIDVWYELPSGDTLHVWQSNAVTPEKDPVRETGKVVTGTDGQPWVVARLDDARIQYATRWPDDVTMTVDFPSEALDRLDLLRSFSGQARPAPPQP